jgi:hypothetical protein
VSKRQFVCGDASSFRFGKKPGIDVSAIVALTEKLDPLFDRFSFVRRDVPAESMADLPDRSLLYLSRSN